MATEARRTPDPYLPKRIGSYEAFLQIGAGGMARVYLAVRSGSANPNEVVVIKVLGREVVEDEQALTLFMDEARIATVLRHPNIIHTREVVAQPPDYLLAMEFQDGQSLLEVLRRVGRPALPVHEHIWIVTQVLAALHYAHTLKDASGRPLGIVHRDVSPSNVLVCYSGQVKLLDFGIAKASGALAATQDGVIKGKLGYAAPEQCLGMPTDARADVYAVGVMLWEAIAGRRRASGETRRSVLQARIDDAEPRLEGVCPGAPAELCGIVARALGHDPGTRYTTAREFQTDLEAYLVGHLVANEVQVGPSRIAALLAPHFAQDRTALRRAIEAHLRALGTGRSGQRPRVPLPAPLPSVRAPAGGSLPLNDVSPLSEEEDTSRIQVDEALLRSSRQPSVRPPAADGVLAPVEHTLASHAGSPAARALSSGAASSAPAASPVEVAPVVGATPLSRSPVPGAPLGTDAEPEPFGLVKKLPPQRWLLGAVGAIVVVVVAVVATHRSHSPEQVAAPAVVHGAPAEEGARPSSAATDAPPAPNQVSVRLSATPPDAELRLDGRLLRGNPFVSRFPKDDAIHELSVSADGYREEKQVIQFMTNVNLEIALRHVRGGVPRVAAMRPAAPSPAAPARTSGDPRAAASPVEPGMDLKVDPAARGKRNIDDKDPYNP